MTKRGQNRLVQITLHVHTHTIGGYGIGVNRPGSGWAHRLGTGLGRIVAGNSGVPACFPQTFALLAGWASLGCADNYAERFATSLEIWRDSRAGRLGQGFEARRERLGALRRTSLFRRLGALLRRGADDFRVPC